MQPVDQSEQKSSQIVETSSLRSQPTCSHPALPRGCASVAQTSVHVSWTSRSEKYYPLCKQLVDERVHLVRFQV